MSEQSVTVTDQRDQLDELGPIDYLVIEFPGGRMPGGDCRCCWTWWIVGSSGSSTCCS